MGAAVNFAVYPAFLRGWLACSSGNVSTWVLTLEQSIGVLTVFYGVAVQNFLVNSLFFDAVSFFSWRKVSFRRITSQFFFVRGAKCQGRLALGCGYVFFWGDLCGCFSVVGTLYNGIQLYDSKKERMEILIHYKSKLYPYDWHQKATHFLAALA